MYIYLNYTFRFYLSLFQSIHFCFSSYNQNHPDLYPFTFVIKLRHSSHQLSIDIIIFTPSFFLFFVFLSPPPRVLIHQVQDKTYTIPLLHIYFSGAVYSHEYVYLSSLLYFKRFLSPTTHHIINPFSIQKPSFI